MPRETFEINYTIAMKALLNIAKRCINFNGTAISAAVQVLVDSSLFKLDNNASVAAVSDEM